MKPIAAVFLLCVLANVLLLPMARSAENLSVVLEQQRALQAELDAGETAGMTTREVNTIRKAQKEVFAVSDGKTSLEEMSIDEKVRLENALEQINATVKGGRAASQEQEVCWRERKSGSTMKVTRCGTQAERDQAREGARAWMEKPKICVPPGCGQ